MRLAILADIHGNFQALQAVLADLDGIGVDAVVSLGDNIGYGPQPEEVVQALMAREIDSVVGNHELALSSASYLLRLNPSPRISLEISRQLMSRESLCLLPVPAHVSCAAWGPFCPRLPAGIRHHLSVGPFRDQAGQDLYLLCRTALFFRPYPRPGAFCGPGSAL